MELQTYQLIYMMSFYNLYLLKSIQTLELFALCTIQLP